MATKGDTRRDTKGRHEVDSKGDTNVDTAWRRDVDTRGLYISDEATRAHKAYESSGLHIFPGRTSTPGTQPPWPALSAVVFIPFWLGRSRDWRQPITALRVKFCAQHAALLGATVRQQQSIWRINEMYTLATREELRIIYNV